MPRERRVYEESRSLSSGKVAEKDTTGEKGLSGGSMAHER